MRIGDWSSDVCSSDLLAELAESISQRGVIQPIIVRPQGGGYQIIAGERRWRAAQRAQLHRIPAIVRDFNDAETMEIALIENIQREDLNPIRSEEHTSELQSLIRISYAVLRLKKKKKK